MTLEEIVTVLTEERKRRGWSYRDVSSRCPYPGLSDTAIFKHERRAHEPNVLTLATWAAAFGKELVLDLKTKQQGDD